MEGKPLSDKEKVIRWLEACSTGCEPGCPYEYENMVHMVECKADLMRDALELLKAQEPVEPHIKTSKSGTSWWYSCGNCNRAIDPNDKYCRDCGKAVKWDD